MSKFECKIRLAKDISILYYARTKFVSIRELIDGIRHPIYPNKSLGRILFNARYRSGKAIEPIDFFAACNPKEVNFNKLLDEARTEEERNEVLHLAWEDFLQTGYGDPFSEYFDFDFNKYPIKILAMPEKGDSND